MLCGGTMLLIISAFSGELNGFTLAAVHTEAWVAWVYLTIFGSIVAFSAFSWLLKVENPNKVATFAYVNPVIALFLGWFFRDEILNTQSLIAAAMMILGVVFINFSKTKEREKVSAWYFIGLFLPIISFIILLCLPDNKNPLEKELEQIRIKNKMLGLKNEVPKNESKFLKLLDKP